MICAKLQKDLIYIVTSMITGSYCLCFTIFEPGEKILCLWPCYILKLEHSTRSDEGSFLKNILKSILHQILTKVHSMILFIVIAISFTVVTAELTTLYMHINTIAMIA